MNLDEAVTTLTGNPQYAAEIFKMSAEGTSQPKIHKRMLDAGFVVSQEVVRRVLHRQEPFTDLRIYEMVDPKHEAIAKSKFHSVGARRAKRAKCPVSNVPLLNECLSARVAYEAAIRKAVEAGMKRESIEAWCDVVAVGDLS